MQFQLDSEIFTESNEDERNSLVHEVWTTRRFVLLSYTYDMYVALSLRRCVIDHAAGRSSTNSKIVFDFVELVASSFQSLSTLFHFFKQEAFKKSNS